MTEACPGGDMVRYELFVSQYTTERRFLNFAERAHGLLLSAHGPSHLVQTIQYDVTACSIKRVWVLTLYSQR